MTFGNTHVFNRTHIYNKISVILIDFNDVDAYIPSTEINQKSLEQSKSAKLVNTFGTIFLQFRYSAKQ